MKNDNVNHPSHYTDGNIEVIDFIEDKGLSFHLGNAVKYIARAGKKNPDAKVEDLQKALWYLDREIQRLGSTSKAMMIEALKKFAKGEWVDTDLICEIFGIEFGEGMKEFEFSRTAEWNPAPLNGQKITTKFHIKTFERENASLQNKIEKAEQYSRILERALLDVLGTSDACTEAYKRAEDEIRIEEQIAAGDRDE